MTTEALKRPAPLTMLCILTFIFSGMTTFSSAVAPLMSESLSKVVNESPMFNEDMRDQFAFIMKAGWGYHLTTMLLSLGAVIGAAFMWKLQKQGFHIYAISTLCLLFVPPLFLSMPLHNVSIFVTLMHIGVYGLFFKLFK